MFSDHSSHSARRAITDPLVCSVRSFFYLLRAPSETDGTVNVAAKLPGNECGCCQQHVCPVPTDESAAKNTSQGSSLGSRPLSWEAPPPPEIMRCACGEKPARVCQVAAWMKKRNEKHGKWQNTDPASVLHRPGHTSAASHLTQTTPPARCWLSPLSLSHAEGSNKASVSALS